ncbi:valyl-tRNA synthetase [Carboxydocella sporoproducens DSM 16521]|uniref:Valine--tRNA ligase n=2 Tax=Carboxydocella TaxID=178898 RepID=A0A1T4SM06_9FIRM|nr:MULTISPECIES: valine--tRNA ligase [Carboxydocella]AVX21486.1 valyl-tRNA synthetase [Carboxydocella thermautotrophica]AVX31974.1 valyl-tRNA synthetase [Carboxydocella thermautotrophica]SKA29320.1 valyl-tRNA synthetase [Carboxydocella sporoproducens DSM 16521]
MTTATRSGQLPTTYNPQEVESKWYSRWEEKGYFHAEVDKNKEPFSIVMPPPNVTGALHMGHALDNTMQDILIRWKRMQGYNTLWMPGTDHAGIATQAKVEEQLAKEGLSKYDLGREKFLERVWDWKNTYGDRITKQLRRLGASCDWQRERFTMDEGCSKAVRDVFVELYNKGLIYRGSYIINWCPKCMTTISDIEVEHEETAGKLYHIAYPVKDSQERIIVATTRPETMLGDVAVAVHPEDERYRHLIGKTLILPILGREIPVIADEYVEKEFGTGAVKITPAHDLNDFEIGQRHHLPQITVMTREGLMNEEAGPYQGMERYACRAQIVKDLEAQGYLVKVEEHTHAVGHCYRCDTVIEPMVSPQWFVKMKPLAEPAIKVVQEGKLRFVPERFTKIYINWLENIRDWCISRQLWWGHRIPVWYCQDCGAEICAKENPTSCPHCGSTNLEQDPDVLDTWFSSALWPFSTMGWPEQTEELAHFYPTSVLVTGRDIIFFWVARMIFMGLEFMQERPFKEVLIHGLVLDAQGRKMSKSLGNGVDPIDIIDQYGADTLRFMLITGNTPGNDLRFQQERLEGTRNFANKIWNAARFALLNLGDFKPEEVQPELALADRWILSRLNHTIEEVTRQLDRYELGEAARVLYDFIWSEFCDWYIELIKPRLYGKETPGSRATAQWTLWYVLSRTMELLHPFMPFITEEIWQALPHQGETIMLAPWPQVKPEYNDSEAEAAMELLMEAIRAVRNIRAEMNVPPSRQIAAILAANREENLAVLQAGASYLKQLAGIGELELVLTLPEKPAQAAAAVAKGVEIYLPLAGLIDIEKEKERLARELAKVEEDLARVEAKLNNESFVARAPAAVVEKEKARAAEYREKAEALRERLAALG